MKSVLAQVVRKNSYDFNCLHQESILCANAVVEGVYWRIPTVSKGVHTGFQYRKNPTKPTVDSLRTLRVNDRVNQIIYYVAIADAADTEIFNEFCNDCCGENSSLPTVALPTIFIEEPGCPDEEGDYLYFANVTTPLEGDQVYKLSGSVNGVALPTAPAEGFADLAALETWADANWSTGDLDGVTVVGGKVTLNAGPSGKTGVINITTEGMYESNTPGALTTGQNYHLAATINTNVLAPLDTAANAALSTMATLANATPAYRAYGIWSVVSGKVRLVSDGTTLSSASLVVTKITIP